MEMGAAASKAAAAPAANRMLIGQKMCTGRRPVHKSRKLITFSPDILSALAAAGCRRGRIGRSRGSGCGGACIILAVVDIAVHDAIIILVGPDRAGETADRSADHRALEDADARDDRTG